MEYRITIRLAEHGRLGAMDRIVDAFQRVHPEVGAVARANLKADTLDLVFGFDALDLAAAVEAAESVFSAGFAEAGLELTEIVHAELDRVSEREVRTRLISAGAEPGPRRMILARRGSLAGECARPRAPKPRCPKGPVGSLAGWLGR